MFRQTPIRSIALAVIVGALALYAMTGGYYAREIVTNIAVLALLAVALDVVAGFGGMISLCHGAIHGIAAYGFAAMTVNLGLPAWLAALIGLALAVAFGAVVGAVSTGASGIFFMMVTLAFGQMAYVVIFRWGWLGGDDGLAGAARFDLSWLGINMNNSVNFALFALIVLLAGYALAATVLRSAFGHTLIGIKDNEARMRAMGVNTRLHKTLAFAFSAFLAALAGLLAAQHTQFVSPELTYWVISGEVLIVVILGGIGTLAGPVLGAAVLVLLKNQIDQYTIHWHIVIGLVLIGTVLAGGRGIFGEIEHRLARWRAARDAGEAQGQTDA